MGAPDVVNRFMDEAHRPSGDDENDGRRDKFEQEPFECEQPLSFVWEGVGSTLPVLFVVGGALWRLFGPPWTWR